MISSSTDCVTSVVYINIGLQLVPKNFEEYMEIKTADPIGQVDGIPSCPKSQYDLQNESI